MKTPIEFQIEVGRAGYTRSVSVVSYSSCGDGTDRRRTLGQVTRTFTPGIERATESGADADAWQAAVLDRMHEAIHEAVRVRCAMESYR